MTTLSEHFRFYNTDDADAVASDIREGKIAYINGGKVTGNGAPYHPAMMEFDGASYYAHTTPVTSGNKVTVAARFQIASFTGGGARTICQMIGPTNYRRVLIQAFASDHGGLPDRLYVQVRNSANVTICQLAAPLGYIDGQPHTLFFSFDGDVGAAVFRIDGADADDTGYGSRTAPTTGTLDTGASSEFLVGARTTAPADAWIGELGFVGYRDAYLTNWQDFMYANGNPKQLNEFGWTQWGGGTFAPASQDFNGTTGYFNKAVTSAGSAVTAVARLKISSFTGTKMNCIRYNGPAGIARISVEVGASDDADSDFQSRLSVNVLNSVGTSICKLYSNVVVCDGQEHCLFFSFDAPTGNVVFKIDGADADNASASNRVTPTTGTLDLGASSNLFIGANQAPAQYVNGELGFCGVEDAYLTNWSDFMDATGVPQEIDELNWTEWGGQPLFWNKYGAMDSNKGSAGNMTRNGTVTHTPNSQPPFWHEAAKMDEQLGSAGVMTENGTIVVGKGGNV